MKQLWILIKRNTRIFFRDKGMFITSLITPIILLVLYVTFLGKVYRDSFVSALNAANFTADDTLINGCVAGQLFSSLLAVCCVTVSFCSNMLMVQDKVTGASSDFSVSPIKKSKLAFGYFIATAFSTLIVCFAAAAACFIYTARVGWYMSALDVALLIADIILLVLFGTALSSIINYFLSSQGQISAVGTVVSSGYGFICGAYMPISQFPEALKKIISFFPGTYGTSLMRNHALRGVFSEMEAQSFPDEVIKGIKESIDCRIFFFDKEVTQGAMYLVIAGTVIVLLSIYILINNLRLTPYKIERKQGSKRRQVKP